MTHTDTQSPMAPTKGTLAEANALGGTRGTPRRQHTPSCPIDVVELTVHPCVVYITGMGTSWLLVSLDIQRTLPTERGESAYRGPVLVHVVKPIHKDLFELP